MQLYTPALFIRVHNKKEREKEILYALDVIFQTKLYFF